MRLRMNEKRERRFDNAMEATGEGTKSGALDVAADFYIRMSGGSSAVPNGQIDELMQLAIDQGSVTPSEIADVLSTSEFPIDFSQDYDSGRE